MSGGKGGGWFGKAAMKVHQKVSRDVCRPSMQKGKVTGGGVNRACFCLFACLLSLLPNHQQVLKISVCFSKWGTNKPCLKQFLRTTTTKNSSFTWRGARWLLCLAAHSGAVYVITQSLGLGQKKNHVPRLDLQNSVGVGACYEAGEKVPSTPADWQNT